MTPSWAHVSSALGALWPSGGSHTKADCGASLPRSAWSAGPTRPPASS